MLSTYIETRHQKTNLTILILLITTYQHKTSHTRPLKTGKHTLNTQRHPQSIPPLPNLSNTTELETPNHSTHTHQTTPPLYLTPQPTLTHTSIRHLMPDSVSRPAHHWTFIHYRDTQLPTFYTMDRQVFYLLRLHKIHCAQLDTSDLLEPEITDTKKKTKKETPDAK